MNELDRSVFVCPVCVHVQERYANYTHKQDHRLRHVLITCSPPARVLHYPQGREKMFFLGGKKPINTECYNEILFFPLFLHLNNGRQYRTGHCCFPPGRSFTASQPLLCKNTNEESLSLGERLYPCFWGHLNLSFQHCHPEHLQQTQGYPYQLCPW